MANNNHNSSSSSCSSIIGQYRWNDDSEWVVRITRGEEKTPLIDTSVIDPCICKVPNTLTDLKPEAYFPQKIGLGPYHHFRSDLYYRMERNKFDAVTRLLLPTNQVPLNSQHHLILKFTEYDDVVRSFYKECCLDLNAQVLAWVLVIDSFFLLHYLRINHLKTDGYSKMKEWAKDIAMLENQIPLILLWTIYRSIQPTYEVELSTDFQNYGCDSLDAFELEMFNDMAKRGGVLLGQDPHLTYSYNFERELQNALGDTGFGIEDVLGTLLYQTLLTFCEQNSPFKLPKLEPYIWYNRSHHLLDYMYNLIVCDDEKLGPQLCEDSESWDIDEPISKIMEFLQVIGTVLGLTRLQEIQKVLTFVTNIPWKVILDLSRKVYKSDDNKGAAAAKKMEIPSASKLKEIGGVKFELTTWHVDGLDHIGYIKDICFNEKDLIFRLPLITLDGIDSEVILRNLMAHEELMDKHRRPIRIVDYVHLMHGIICTTEDGKLLRDANIIDGSLGDDKIVEFFDGISKSTGSTDRESYLKETIDAVNKHFHNRPRVKARRYMKKCLYTSWKLVVFVASVVTILQLILKALCAVYDCNNTFHHKQGASATSPADLGLDMFPTL